MLPISGSAYTYAYATMGEVTAFIIGWDLVLEYLVGAAAVSVGWSSYVVSLFERSFHVQVSPLWTRASLEFDPVARHFITTGSYVNLPAVMIVLAITGLLTIGIRESALFNSVAVVVKVAVVVVFIFAGVGFVNPSNWNPFIPANTGTFGQYGVSGVLQGATTVFFSYIGFDAVSTAAQVCSDAQSVVVPAVTGFTHMSLSHAHPHKYSYTYPIHPHLNTHPRHTPTCFIFDRSARTPSVTCPWGRWLRWSSVPSCTSWFPWF